MGETDKQRVLVGSQEKGFVYFFFSGESIWNQALGTTALALSTNIPEKVNFTFIGNIYVIDIIFTNFSFRYCCTF